MLEQIRICIFDPMQTFRLSEKGIKRWHRNFVLISIGILLLAVPLGMYFGYNTSKPSPIKFAATIFAGMLVIIASVFFYLYYKKKLVAYFERIEYRIGDKLVARRFPPLWNREFEIQSICSIRRKANGDIQVKGSKPKDRLAFPRDLENFNEAFVLLKKLKSDLE